MYKSPDINYVIQVQEVHFFIHIPYNSLYIWYMDVCVNRGKLHTICEITTKQLETDIVTYQ